MHFLEINSLRMWSLLIVTQLLFLIQFNNALPVSLSAANNRHYDPNQNSQELFSPRELKRATMGSSANHTHQISVLWMNLFGILLGTCFIAVVLCCAKKRSGSYGTNDNYYKNDVPIFRLKSKNESEIPGPPKIDSKPKVILSSPPAQNSASGASCLDESQSKSTNIFRTTDSKLTTNKTITKGDISPPVHLINVSTPEQKIIVTNLPFSNPDPEKDPLKPFTYSPIPQVRAEGPSGKLKITTSEIPVHDVRKSPSPIPDRYNNRRSPTGMPGLPFWNPDPLTEPLKPFTYSPIPVRQRSSKEIDINEDVD